MHTPGPWIQSNQVSHGGFKIIGHTGEPVCVCPSSVKLDNDIKEANALLIVAAPDLYQACWEVIKATRGGVWSDAIAACEAAIRKANGK